MGFLSYAQRNQQIALGDYSPEKAGVGGSTPSLATIFQSLYLTSNKTSQSALSPLFFRDIRFDSWLRWWGRT